MMTLVISVVPSIELFRGNQMRIFSNLLSLSRRFEGKISLEDANSKIVFNRAIAFDVNGKDEIYSSLIESILGILSENYGLVLK